MRGKALTQDDIKIILELGLQNLTCAEIAKITGFCSQTIANVARRNNVLFKNMRASFNQEFFSQIDTQEKAYILGLLYSDGYLLTTRGNDSGSFGIALKDREILEKMRTAMSSNHRINEYTATGNYINKQNPGCYYRLIFTSDTAYSDLIKLGLTTNKTNVLLFPNEKQVPKNLLSHFIRGIFDGDGSLSRWCDNEETGHLKYTMTFTGTNEICSGIQQFFGTSIKLSQRFPERKVNNYTLSYCGNLSIKNKLAILYNDANIYLERKYKLWEELNKIY